MPKRTLLIGLLSFSLAAAAALPAMADSFARAVRLSFVRGDVQADRVGTGFERAFRNMPVIEGMRLWAGENSRAEVEFEDGSAVRLADNSLAELAELRLRDGTRLNHVVVEQGIVYFDVRRKDAADFRVSFGGRQVYVPKDARFRVHVLAENASLAVLRGDVEMFGEAPGRDVRVRKGETVSVEFADPSRYFLAKGVTTLAFDAWVEERIKFRERELAVAGSPASVPYYMVTDLDPYGAYFHHASYGRLWRPYHVGLHWDPFARGAWVWYPHFGFVWVSYHPWGWAPYRYGTWVFVSNVGWCWNPLGFRWSTWHRVPVWRHAPPAYKAPAPPAVTNVTVVVNVDNGTRNDAERTRLAGGGSRETAAPVLDGATADSGVIRTRTQLAEDRDVGEFVARASSNSAIPDRRSSFRPAEEFTPRTLSTRPSAGEASGEPASTGGWQRQPLPRDNGIVTRSQPAATAETPAATTTARPRPEPRRDLAAQPATPAASSQTEPSPTTRRDVSPPPSAPVTRSQPTRPETTREAAPAPRTAPTPASQPQTATPEPRRERPTAPETRSAPAPPAAPEARMFRSTPVPRPGPEVSSRGAEPHPQPQTRASEAAAPVRSFAPVTRRSAPSTVPSRSYVAPATTRSAPAPGAARGYSAPVATRSAPARAARSMAAPAASAPATRSGGRGAQMGRLGRTGND
jgi:hypothetical protein